MAIFSVCLLLRKNMFSSVEQQFSSRTLANDLQRMPNSPKRRRLANEHQKREHYEHYAFALNSHSVASGTQFLIGQPPFTLSVIHG